MSTSSRTLLPSQTLDPAPFAISESGRDKSNYGTGVQEGASTNWHNDYINKVLPTNSSVGQTNLVTSPDSLPNPSKGTDILGDTGNNGDSRLVGPSNILDPLLQGSTPTEPASPPPRDGSSQPQPASAAPPRDDSSQPQPAPAAPPPSADLLNFPTDFMKNIEDYGAKPNDGIDDTAAIQKALDDGRRDANGKSIHDDYFGRPKTLYFPAGTYNVSDTLDWIGCNVTLQGQGSDATVIQLQDNAPGFNNSAAPKAVIKTPEGNASFRQNIWNLSVNTGENNSGAIGIDYISNNVGAIRDVKIKSEDGEGFAGLAMDRQWPGPSLIKNVQIEGYKYGIRVTPGEYGPTFENITLKNQQVAGINNVYGTLTIRGLNSTNEVPVIKGTHWAGMITLVDANLKGGSSSVSAIESEGQLYLRNINTDGYQSAVKYKGNVVDGTKQTEYASNVYQVFDSPNQSLNLPIQETPEFHDNNTENWGSFQPKWYGETGGLQSLFDSDKSTIYFKSDKYYSYNETVVKVPASVKRIVGFSSVVNQDPRGINGGGIKFLVAENSSDPLIIEGFGYGVKVQHESSRPVALKHGGYQYTSGTNPGNLFLEDVNIEPLRIKPGQKVWARQFNNEYGSQGSKIINDGGTFWVMGLKTERAGTVIKSENGAETEMLGGVILPTHKLSDEEKTKPAFVNTDSRTSLVYRDLAHDPAYDYHIQVEDTRDGQTRQMLTSETPRQVTLFTASKE